MNSPPLPLTPGAALVHPRLGVATVLAVESRTIDGAPVDFARIAVASGRSQFMPAERLAATGWRALTPPAGDVLVLLAGPLKPLDADALQRWPTEGDAAEVCAVARALAHQRQRTPPEQVAFDVAVHRLCVSVAAARGVDLDGAFDLVVAALRAVRPTP